MRIMRAEVKVEEKHDLWSWDRGSVPTCDLGTWDMPNIVNHLDSLRWYHLDQRCYSGCLPRFGVSTQGWFPEYSRVKSFMLDVEFPCYFCWVWSCFKMIRAIIYIWNHDHADVVSVPDHDPNYGGFNLLHHMFWLKFYSGFSIEAILVDLDLDQLHLTTSRHVLVS